MNKLHTLILGVASLVVGTLSSSGISTHMEVADRAMLMVNSQSYSDLSSVLQEYPQTVRVGAVYPDWGYLWPRLSGEAEDAHWPPFQTEALNYVHDTYGEPWTPHVENLFAFICGIGCHGAMDDAWHFGNTSFLTQAINNDLPDWDSGDAEAVIEVLTDFFVQADFRNAGLEDYLWWVPVDDLYAIHQKAGHVQLKKQDIILGVNLQRVGLLLEDLLWPIVEPLTAPMLPWTRSNYASWHDGGVDDGANLSARRFEELWNEYAVIAASRPDTGNGRVLAGHLHLDENKQSIILELAKQLIADELVEIQWRNVKNGAILVERPIIVDLPAVEARLRKAIS